MEKLASLFYIIVIGLMAASLVSCSGGGDGDTTAAEAGTEAEAEAGDAAETFETSDLNGSWAGTWSDLDDGSSGTLSLAIALDGNSFSSVLTFMRNGETTIPGVNGTVSGSAVAFSGGGLSFLASATSTTMSGSVTGGFFGEPVNGTFEMHK